MAKPFEIAFIFPYVSQKLPAVEGFLKDLKKEYPSPALQGLDLFSWSSGDSLGVLLSFDFSSFVPHDLKRIKASVEKVGGRIFELMAFGEREKKEFKDKLILTSDIKFAGDYDLSFALRGIATRINATLGRKHPRYDASIKVSFKTEKQFVHEYAKNISKGGIFVATDKPLPLRSRVEIEFSLPNYTQQIKVVGEVVQVVTIEQSKLMDAGKFPGMGIQFLEFEGDSQKLLDDYLASLK